jgi:hypothetical protein
MAGIAECINNNGWYCRIFQLQWLVLQNASVTMAGIAENINNNGWYCRIYQ